MQGQTILFVEDEILIRMLLTDALRDAGYEVVEAVNGEEGLTVILSGQKLDLLITDVKMPGALDGSALAEQWKERHPGLPFLISSAHLLPEEVPEGGELLAKPYSDALLLRTVERLIGPPCQSKAPKRTA